MLKKNQVKFLQSLAQNYKAVIQIGKKGLTDSAFKSIEENLLANELVKIKILNNCGLDAKSTGKEIADYFDAEFITSLGNSFVLYRENPDKRNISLPK